MSPSFSAHITRHRSMAKNSQGGSKNKKQENRVCEKIFRAVTSPVRTVRRISTRPSPRHPAEETSKPITKMEPKKKVIGRVDTKVKTDERFTDYIKKAKLKIRAMTNLGDMTWETSETDIETRDHHHHHHVPISHEGSSSTSSDQFSEYIKKAKMKLRSSSTIARANPPYDSFR